MRRSHAITARARAYQDDKEQKTRVGHMLAALKKDFAADVVLRRLDAADELDRKAMERRLANMPPPLDLGEDE